ncbi:MAG: hypothetical protein AB7K41_14690, partial [Bdellovibrionales bacterium]
MKNLYFTLILGLHLPFAEGKTLRSVPTKISVGVVVAPPTGSGWTEIPNTKLLTLCPDDAQYPGITGVEGCRAVVDDWNSAAFDSNLNRLLLFGGGHDGYYGNEIYAFNLDTLSISRLTDPGFPIAPKTPGNCVDAIAGGTQPNSRHTYDGLVFVRDANVMLSISGAVAHPTSCARDSIWAYNFGLAKWENKVPDEGSPISTYGGVVSGYDSDSKLTYIIDDYSTNNLFSYDHKTSKLTKLGAVNGINSTYSVGTVARFTDKNNAIQKWFVVSNANQLVAIDLKNNYKMITLNPGPINASYGGLAFYPKRESLVYWRSGAPVHEFSLKNQVWTIHNFIKGPTPGRNNYVMEKFSYSEKSD